MKTLIPSSKLTTILFCLVLSAGFTQAQPASSNLSSPVNHTWYDYQNLHLKGGEMKSLSDSMHQSSYDTVAAAFKLVQRTFHTYDSGGILVQRTKLSKDKNGNWKNYSNDTLTYIGFQLRKVVNQQWDAQQSVWKNALKFDYFYDTTNVLTSIIMSTWKSDDALWEFSEKQSYSYNDAGLQTEDLYQVWNENLNVWEKRSRITNNYNGSVMTTELYEQWDPVALSWQNYSRNSFTYSAGKLTQILSEGYVQALSSWVNLSRNSLTYNPSGYKETNTEEIWSGGSWMNSAQETFTYVDINLKSTLLKKWQEHLNDWRNFTLSESFFSDHEVFGIKEVVAAANIIRNPISRGSSVHLNLESAQGQVELLLFSINGKKVVHTVVGQQENFNIPSDIPAGIYLLHCRQKSGFIRVQKIFITE